MKRYSNNGDRQEIMLLREQGMTIREVATQTGWSFELVRKVCRAYKREGVSALSPKPVGRPATSILSTFEPIVRYAVLRIKLQHPGWGPDVVYAELAKQPWARRVMLPSPSSISAYWSQFGERLVTVRGHKQLPQTKPMHPPPKQAHSCWQIDVDEKVEVPGYGLAHIINVVDYATGIKLAAYLVPTQREGKACKASQRQWQEALRRAFARWGLPDRVRTDRDRVAVPDGNYPFPSKFTLWLQGLGIAHELIRRVTQNGSVERAHRTWQGRLSGYGPFTSLVDWQAIVDYELWRMNAILPSRGRGCKRQPPLTVYPQAKRSKRPYRRQDEALLFDLEAVYAYLSHGKWLRHTSAKGQFSLNNHKPILGVTYKNLWVTITFDPSLGFVVSCPDGATITTLQLPGLTAQEILD